MILQVTMDGLRQGSEIGNVLLTDSVRAVLAVHCLFQALA